MVGRLLIAFTWELPQTIVALFCAVILRCTKANVYNDRFSFIHKAKGISSFSLGEFIFLTSYGYKIVNTVKHEYGHSIQSRIMGPLYLILVGLPSAIWNLLARKIDWCYDHYYDTPWEHMADRLGKVKR